MQKACFLIGKRRIKGLHARSSVAGTVRLVVTSFVAKIKHRRQSDTDYRFGQVIVKEGHRMEWHPFHSQPGTVCAQTDALSHKNRHRQEGECLWRSVGLAPLRETFI